MGCVLHTFNLRLRGHVVGGDVAMPTTYDSLQRDGFARGEQRSNARSGSAAVV